MVNQTNDTKFAVECVAPGVYFFTVLAVNVLGDGQENSVSIMGGFAEIGIQVYGFKMLHCCMKPKCLFLPPSIIYLYNSFNPYS